ncbi:ATP-binding protein [Haloplasma contractile]|nr:SbcC/MukB-like Walker B domain-containing protein [Haloplasma contractile]
MKKLMKIKLINWHYLANETIPVEGNCLITGENGAGKSTILDAIQYVLTAGKQYFNSAANDKAKRDLMGYVRCKTGRDSNQYERTGDVSSHIALEFLDEKKKKSFIIGAVIDSSGNLSTPKVNFYRIEDQKMNESLFLQENHVPRTISNFKATIKGKQAKVLTTQNEARKDFRHRFGSLNDRFFELLPKALAFKPINKIKDFVYSYLLDEKDVDIEYLKDNIHTLREYEKYLKIIKQKLTDLESIDRSYQEYLNIEETIKIQDYIIKRASKELNEQNINNKKHKLSTIETKLDLVGSKLNQTEKEIEERSEEKANLDRSLANDDTYQAIRELEKTIRSLNIDLDTYRKKEQKLDYIFHEAFTTVKEMNALDVNLASMVPFYEYKNETISEANMNDLINKTKSLSSEIDGFKDQMFNKKATLDFKRSQEQEGLAVIEQDIKSLSSKKLVYPRYVTDLQQAIHQGLKRELGKDIEPKILCELLNVKDDKWQNAIEGYLNTQRFNLIIEPEYFDHALEIYERVKYKRNIHTTGLVNTKRLKQYEESDENSLSYMVTSKNKHASNYVNMLLNKVVRCETVDELKNHRIAITPTCMVYKNKTARQIKEDVYKIPFIGQDAYKKQLEQKRELRAEKLAILSDYRDKINHCIHCLDLCKRLNLNYIIENSEIKINVQNTVNKISENEKKLNKIDRASMLDLQIHIEQVNKELKEIKQKEKQLIKDLQDLQVEERILNNKLDELNGKSSSLTPALNQVIDQIISVLNKAESRYQDATEKYNHLEKLIDVYTSQRSGQFTRRTNVLNELQSKQRDYNRDYDFGAAPGVEGMDTYYEESKRLKDSKVIEYEEKIRQSKKKAEEQFKDEFISKLQEHILMAQNEFKKLNNALEGIFFGEDEYKFDWKPSKQYRKFYDMITDDSNLGGNTLFGGSFRERHKEALDDLFDRISLNDEQSQKALEEYTDYRTYMDYDIKIMHRSGSTSSFSKVCREKSGGETQTPYYVAIAASFIQLYHTNHLGGDSIGIILFDEAFDKMDENRIESMMEFLNKLDLQVILAAPPQKIETISPFVKTNLVIYRDEHGSYVEPFLHEKL